MLAAPSYDSLVKQLGDAFRTRYSNQPRVFATGLLLCRPESDFVQKNVLPNIEYLDRVSADYVDFFCVGYTAHPFDGPQPKNVICQNSDSWWTFSVADFVAFQKALEADYSADRLSWRYSGNCDLLMMNATSSPQVGRAELGFETVMAFNVENAIKDSPFTTFSNLIVEFTSFLEKQDPSDPVFALSDKIGRKFAKHTVWEVIWDLLPLKLGESAKKAAYFATQRGG